MNLMRSLVIVAVCSLALPIAAVATEADVLAILKPVADATLRGDLAAAIEIMYEPALEDLGGRKALLEGAATMKRQMNAAGMQLKRYEYKPPLRFIQGKEKRYVVVPSLTEMIYPGGGVRVHGFELGVEVAPGKWRFLTGSNAKKETIAKYFPDFPAGEKLPEIRNEDLAPKKR
jgi:hypothetical protein